MYRFSVVEVFLRAASIDSAFVYLDNGVAGTGLVRAAGAVMQFFKNLSAVAWQTSVDLTYISAQLTFEVS